MTNLLIFDSHPIIRRGLKELLTEMDESFTYFETASVNGLKKIMNQQRIDLIVIGLNEKTKIDSSLISKYDAVPWILMYNDDMYQEALLLTIAGAMGCIAKSACIAETKKCITEVLKSNVFVCNNTLTKFGYEYLFNSDHRNHFNTFFYTGLKTRKVILSSREKEIAGLLLKGQRTSEIATTLNLKQSTISTIKRSIFLKKNVRNIVELSAAYED